MSIQWNVRFCPELDALESLTIRAATQGNLIPLACIRCTLILPPGPILGSGITSFSPAEADANRLLELSREHWQVENRLRRVRDADLREDECRVRRRGIAQILAALRNAIARLLRASGAQPLVAGIEHFAQHRDDAIDTLFKRIK
ncbi:MAG: transposase [Planctomycetota bacterium]|nr:transposase [Planctomycetota bacterium]